MLSHVLKGVGFRGYDDILSCDDRPHPALSPRAVKPAVIVILACLGILTSPVTLRLAAASETIDVAGVVYDLPDDNRYDWASSPEQALASFGDNARARLLLSGDVKEGKIVDGVPGYVVVSGNVDLSCELQGVPANAAAAGWEPSDDVAKTVGGVDLGDKAGSGAIVLQSSTDRNRWSTDAVATDVFADAAQARHLYTTKDIQLQNGCYYRVLIAYELCRYAGDSKILMVTRQDYEFKNVVEMFEFYAVTIDGSQRTKSSDTPRKKLGTKTNTGLDNGYSQENAIDKDDPHFGWELGEFFVNGYTREADSIDGTPVFLKNLGDRVTLWFHLDQDIDSLNGDDSLTISQDANGHDQRMEVSQTDFGRGTLIVRFTDHEGVAHDPVVYTNYLAANAKTGADTRVQLFEEGDYEVALDYELARASRIGPLEKPDYYNYQIRFTFSIRNGNCMVYPMDAATGAELSSHAITENGFRLDMARSRYLTIDVEKSVLSVGRDGVLTCDVRFNRPAKDGEEYLDPGIYTFTVNNLYTGESTAKTIYVGADRHLLALAGSGLTVMALNEKIVDGYTVAEDGSLLEPGRQVPDEGIGQGGESGSDADSDADQAASQGEGA